MISYRVIWVSLAMLASAFGVYGWFLDNPRVFDDFVIFMPWKDHPPAFWPVFGPRWLSSWSLSIPYLLESKIEYYRFASVLLHTLTGVALYGFLSALWRLLGTERERLPQTWWLVMGIAVLFVVHPAAVYGVAYLAQRSIVLGTLFSLCMWWAFLRALETQRIRWLVISVLSYALALSSKEHTVTAPAVSVLLLLLYLRTHGFAQVRNRPGWLWCLGATFVVYASMAVLVALMFTGILGRAYEPMVANLGTHAGDLQSLDNIYLLSVFNQTALFLKYLITWVIPNPLWMSIDIRESFVDSFWVWPKTAMAAGTAIYCMSGFWLLWKGGRAGLAGFALLAPLVLFLTEFSAVRVQEPFVLYRSYFWMVPLFSILLLLQLRNPRKMALVLVSIALFLSAFALQRASTFSSAFRLWDDAASLAERSGNEEGKLRIYNNRGLTYLEAGMYEKAVDDFSRAMAGNPGPMRALLLKNRATAYFDSGNHEAAFRDMDEAMEMYPRDPLLFDLKGQMYEKQGDQELAWKHRMIACGLEYDQACRAVGSLTPSQAIETLTRGGKPE